MRSTDYLVKAMSKDGQFRAYAVNATQLVQHAHKVHDTWNTASAAFGRSLIGTLLLATSGLDKTQAMTVKIQGDGPVGAIVCDGTADGVVKGYLQNPHVSLPENAQGKLDVSGAVGEQGTLTVTKMSPDDKEPYSGEVKLVSGELGDDFTYYLAQSEQIPSAVGLSVFVNEHDDVTAAGGFLIQVLPGASDDNIARVESSLKKLPLVSQLLREGSTPEELLTKIFGEGQLKFLETMPVSYRCDCSKKRFARAIEGLPTSQLKTLINEDHHAEAVCRFCKKKYEFSEEELKKLLEQKKLNK
ncbi:Hsp33 family molecular chaperone HslO [uncultured Limosilactobacillus sp.]|uniref:Hsp33 family molecular chaperone HslO n=1 Tax=uncultured Limosilactobacillus sp. TaxID=2837629 RepID=UPI0025DE0F4E|nr:Hsp33 family molecular chaperone HslO [uncultured Limosilactobacillus sp.]